MSTVLSRTVSSIIAGRPATDAPGGREASTNPANVDEVVADVLLGDATTFVAACAAARAAQREWAAVPAPVRGRAIQQVGRLVEDNKEALARLVTREIGKPYAESLGEVQEIVDTCNFFLGEGRRLYGQTVPSEMPDKQLFTFRALVSGFGTAGQRCTSLGTVIVDERVHDDFIAQFVAAVEGAAVGDPTRNVL